MMMSQEINTADGRHIEKRVSAKISASRRLINAKFGETESPQTQVT